MLCKRILFFYIIATVFGLLFFFTPKATAWWCEGHMTIAEIAKRYLNPDVVVFVEDAFSNLSKTGPFPKSPDLVQGACWADDLKFLGLEVMRDWHFADRPYERNKTATGEWDTNETVVRIIASLIETLKLQRHPYVLNFALANLVHFFGDVHQPLHAITMVSSQFPNGDHGGREKVGFEGHEMTLHQLWDSVCQGPRKEMKRPLSDDNYAKLKEFADYLEQTYNFTEQERSETDPVVIANESYTIAIEVAYLGIYDGVNLTDEYITKCKATAEARVALAGYRLATALNKIFHDVDILRKTGRCFCPWTFLFSCPCNRKKSVLRAYKQ